jgi:hypothetical protein
MTSLTFPEIPRSLLAYLLDLAGTARVLSPRSRLGQADEPSPAQTLELAGGRVLKLSEEGTLKLSPEFEPAASVLLAPRTAVNLRTWGKDGGRAETGLFFPKTVAEGHGVTVDPAGDGLKIQASLTADEVFERLRSHLPAQEGPPLDFEAWLDVPTAVVLFGILDLARDSKRAETSGPEGSSSGALSRQEIYQYISEFWGRGGPRDFLTFIRTVGLAASPPTSAEAVQAMLSLGEAGVLVEASADALAVSPAVKILTGLADGFEGGIQWQRSSLTEAGTVEKSNRIFLYGSGTPLLCLAPTEDDLIWVSAVQKQELVEFLDFEILSRPPAGRAARPKSRKKPPAASPTCASCGRDLKSSHKFCPFCGAAVGTEKPKSAPPLPTHKSCPKCGTNVRATAKFCTTCGASLS